MRQLTCLCPYRHLLPPPARLYWGRFARKNAEGFARGPFERSEPVVTDRARSVRVRVRIFRTLVSNICAGNVPSFPAQMHVCSERPGSFPQGGCLHPEPWRLGMYRPLSHAVTRNG